MASSTATRESECQLLLSLSSFPPSPSSAIPSSISFPPSFFLLPLVGGGSFAPKCSRMSCLFLSEICSSAEFSTSVSAPCNSFTVVFVRIKPVWLQSSLVRQLGACAGFVQVSIVILLMLMLSVVCFILSDFVACLVFRFSQISI